MKVRNITIQLEEYSKEDKLNETDKLLLEKASASLQNAYAPYSEFKVGAAVLLDNGEIVLGNNQENAAYPSGLCAERVALFHAKSVYPGAEVKAVAITAFSDNFHINHPVTPCGGCRQVIAEVEGRQNRSIRILMKGQSDVVHIVEGITNLLPFMFKEENLKRSKHRNK